jgi:uncharacterized protein with PQ loop repeat
MDFLGEIISYEFGFLAFLIGAIATLFTGYGSMPQIINRFKTKKMDDVSLANFLFNSWPCPMGNLWYAYR